MPSQKLKLNFKVSDFNISGEPIPEDIADKILQLHILPAQAVREDLGIPVWPSMKSGYRSASWEKSRGRNGRSQHCFEEKGATDYTCKNFKSNSDLLLESLIENTEYTRFAVYSTFIHADYKLTASGQREVFSSDHQSHWKFERFV